MPKKPKIQVFQNEAGEFQYRVIAANGEKLAVSESYPTRSNAKRGSEDLIQTVLDIAKERGLVW